MITDKHSKKKTPSNQNDLLFLPSVNIKYNITWTTKRIQSHWIVPMIHFEAKADESLFTSR